MNDPVAVLIQYRGIIEIPLFSDDRMKNLSLTPRIGQSDVRVRGMQILILHSDILVYNEE